jgi:hypothetical protein
MTPIVRDLSPPISFRSRSGKETANPIAFHGPERSRVRGSFSPFRCEHDDGCFPSVILPAERSITGF